MGPDAAGGHGSTRPTPDTSSRVCSLGRVENTSTEGRQTPSLPPSPQHRVGQTGGSTCKVMPHSPHVGTQLGHRSCCLPSPRPLTEAAHQDSFPRHGCPHWQIAPSGLSAEETLGCTVRGRPTCRPRPSPSSGALWPPAGAFSPQRGIPGRPRSGPCPPAPTPSASQGREEAGRMREGAEDTDLHDVM